MRRLSIKLLLIGSPVGDDGKGLIFDTYKKLYNLPCCEYTLYQSIYSSPYSFCEKNVSLALFLANLIYYVRKQKETNMNKEIMTKLYDVTVVLSVVVQKSFPDIADDICQLWLLLSSSWLDH